MINIETINEQYKQCKKITNTLFLVEKKKQKKQSKNGEKMWLDTGIYIYYQLSVSAMVFCLPGL